MSIGVVVQAEVPPVVAAELAGTSTTPRPATSAGAGVVPGAAIPDGGTLSGASSGCADACGWEGLARAFTLPLIFGACLALWLVMFLLLIAQAVTWIAAMTRRRGEGARSAIAGAGALTLTLGLSAVTVLAVLMSWTTLVVGVLTVSLLALLAALVAAWRYVGARKAEGSGDSSGAAIGVAIVLVAVLGVVAYFVARVGMGNLGVNETVRAFAAFNAPASGWASFAAFWSNFPSLTVAWAMWGAIQLMVLSQIAVVVATAARPSRSTGTRGGDKAGWGVPLALLLVSALLVVAVWIGMLDVLITSAVLAVLVVLQAIWIATRFVAGRGPAASRGSSRKPRRGYDRGADYLDDEWWAESERPSSLVSN